MTDFDNENVLKSILEEYRREKIELEDRLEKLYDYIHTLELEIDCYG